MKNTITFCTIWDFFFFCRGEWPRVKDQVVTAKISATFPEAPHQELILNEFCLQLISNSYCSSFSFKDSFLGATPKEWKKSIIIPEAEFHDEYFEKKFIKNFHK